MLEPENHWLVGVLCTMYVAMLKPGSIWSDKAYVCDKIRAVWIMVSQRYILGNVQERKSWPARVIII